ncbi:MAG: AzlC family ABC transporter permease [Proteobacteria bacterium]|nr:AzlC family ABC transporter permease [Pseudomonadota bacterium]MBU1612102.1 AzlC family ABC transporter permease [Pseudomonadota bacterium]
MQAKSSFFAGARTAVPFMLAVFPFGIIYGVITLELGFSSLQTVAFSLFAFAGAAQMAAVQLMAAGAPLWVAAGTALVINLRYFMYSASIALHLKNLPLRAKLPLAYLLTDQSYVASVARFAEDDTVHKGWFYFGTAIPVWIIWQIGTLVGVLLGARIPSTLELDFGIPLVFIGLAVPVMKNRPALAAALVSSLLALAAHTLPLSIGLIVAAVGGIATGAYLDWRKTQ